MAAIRECASPIRESQSETREIREKTRIPRIRIHVSFLGNFWIEIHVRTTDSVPLLTLAGAVQMQARTSRSISPLPCTQFCHTRFQRGTCNTAPLALAEWQRGLTLVAAASAVHLLLHLDLHQIGVVLGQ